jgi:hypothetical protein
MHFGIILLVEAEEKDEAREVVEEFLEENPKGDWWVIGGRWSGTLNPLDQAFRAEAKRTIPHEEYGYSTKILEESRPLLQAKWEEMGGSDVNPLNRDSYKDGGYDDDVMPLSEAISVVRERWTNPIDEAAKHEEAARKEKDTRVRGYYLRIAGTLLSEYFCLDANVYNITTGDYSIPEHPEGWFAVRVDIHG